MNRVLKNSLNFTLILLAFSWASVAQGADPATYLLFQSPEDSTQYEINFLEDASPVRQKTFRIHNDDHLRISLNACAEGDLEDQVIRFEKSGSISHSLFLLRAPPSCRARPHRIYSIYLKKGGLPEEKIADIEFTTLRPVRAFTLDSNHLPEVSYFANGSLQPLRPRNETTNTDMEIRFEKDSRVRVGQYQGLAGGLKVAADPGGSGDGPDIQGEDLDSPPFSVDTPSEGVKTGPSGTGANTGSSVDGQASAEEESLTQNCQLNPSSNSRGMETLPLGIFLLIGIFLFLRKNLTSEGISQ